MCWLPCFKCPQHWTCQPQDSRKISSNFLKCAIKLNYGCSSTRVLIQDELDTPTTNILIEEEQEQPPVCSGRQGLVHNSALIFSRVLLYSLLWRSRFSLAATHCAVLRELMKFWCALKKTVEFLPELIMIMQWWQPESKVSGFAMHQCWH